MKKLLAFFLALTMLFISSCVSAEETTAAAPGIPSAVEPAEPVSREMLPKALITRLMQAFEDGTGATISFENDTGASVFSAGVIAGQDAEPVFVLNSEDTDLAVTSEGIIFKNADGYLEVSFEQIMSILEEYNQQLPQNLPIDEQTILFSTLKENLTSNLTRILPEMQTENTETSYCEFYEISVAEMADAIIRSLLSTLETNPDEFNAYAVYLNDMLAGSGFSMSQIYGMGPTAEGDGEIVPSAEKLSVLLKEAQEEMMPALEAMGMIRAAETMTDSDMRFTLEIPDAAILFELVIADDGASCTIAVPGTTIEAAAAVRADGFSFVETMNGATVLSLDITTARNSFTLEGKAMGTDFRAAFGKQPIRYGSRYTADIRVDNRDILNAEALMYGNRAFATATVNRDVYIASADWSEHAFHMDSYLNGDPALIADYSETAENAVLTLKQEYGTVVLTLMQESENVYALKISGNKYPISAVKLNTAPEGYTAPENLYRLTREDLLQIFSSYLPQK